MATGEYERYGSAIQLTAPNSDYGTLVFRQKLDPDVGDDERIALVIDSSGNVGIDTDTPVANLEIATEGVQGVPGIYLSKTRPALTTSDIAIAGGAVIRAGTGQNYITGQNGYYRWMVDPTDDGSNVTAGLDGAGEMMRLNSSGNLGIAHLRCSQT